MTTNAERKHMNREDIEQAIYERTRRFVSEDVQDAILELIAAEREACAKTIEDDGLAYSFSSITYGRYLAEQIRARSNVE